jgi:ABC-type polysaccharide/polyol phosphate export permease
LIKAFQDILARRELLWNLTQRELKLRYRGSVLGFLWSILIPLFMAVIYVIFLRLLGGRGVPLTDIIIGVFAWQFTVQCVNGGLFCISGNANLVKKVYFPRLILPLSSTLANLVTYLLSLLVQFPFLAALYHFNGGSFSAWIFLLPAVILLHFLFNLALTLLLAAINVYVRDAQHLVGILLSAWFFVSPVMYNLSFVNRVAEHHPWVPHLFLLNPLTIILTAYRAVITEGTTFPWETSSLIAIAIILGLTVAAWGLFQRLQKDFADKL